MLPQRTQPNLLRSDPFPGTESDIPRIRCPACGAPVELDPARAYCSCGFELPWTGKVLEWEKSADDFYEGRYATEIFFNLDRLRQPGGRLLFHFLVYGYYEAILRAVPRGAAVLDIGCAGGSTLLSEWARVTALDRSLHALIIASSRYERAIRADARSFDFAPHSFDAVTSSFFWEHVPPADKDLLLDKFHEWLRPEGKVILLFDVSSGNPLFAWARKRPDLWQEGFIEHDGHYGLEPASEAMRRFSEHGFRVRWWHAMNRSPVQHLPVFGWLAPYGRTRLGVRMLSSWGAWISRHKIPNRVYTGLVQLFDDTLGRLLPLDWSRMLLVVLEKAGDSGRSQAPDNRRANLPKSSKSQPHLEPN